MRTIYLDSEFKCHTVNDGTITAVEATFFDGKCDAFIEGYRFVPAGAVWIREDGVTFAGEMVSPWKPYDLLTAAQAQYEKDQADLQAAFEEGVNSV